MPLELESRVCGRVHVIECKGRIVGGEEAKALEAAILHDTRRDLSQLVIHLGEVTFLDSIGLGLLVRYATIFGKRNGGVRLVAPPPFVAKLLHMTRLTTVLPAFPTEEEAVLLFLQQDARRNLHPKTGPSILLLEQSGDFCTFASAVLAQRGYDVSSVSHARDANVLLRISKPDVLLIGPSTPQVAGDTAAAALRSVSPNASVVRLEPDFSTRDAHEAAGALLQRLFPAAN